MTTEEMEKALENATTEIELLKNQVQELDKVIKERKFLPDTMLLSDKFLKRAFAVLGHYFVASLIIAIPFYVLFFIIFIAAGLFKMF